MLTIRPGKEYSAKAIQERCGLIVPSKEKKEIRTNKLSTERLQPHDKSAVITNNIQDNKNHSTLIPDMGKALDIIMQPEVVFEYLPYQLTNKRKKKKKKKGKGLSNN